MLRARNTIAELERASRSDGRAVWLAKGSLCILDPALAVQLLDNDDRALLVHSDFFGRLGEKHPTREQQREVARDLLRLLSIRLARLRKSGRIMLPERSDWPDFAFAITQEIFADVLLAPETSRRANARLNLFIRKVVAVPKKRPWNRIQVFMLAAAVDKLIDVPPGETESTIDHPTDMIAVLRKWRAELDSEQLVRIFFSAIFSVFKSLPLTLTWAIHDLVSEKVGQGDLRQAITRSMALHPIAWMLERYPAAPMTIDGFEVGPEDTLLISPYLLNRKQSGAQSAPDLWLSFGGGMHECPAASFGFAYVELVLGRLPIADLVFTEPPAASAVAKAVLRPPTFTLERGGQAGGEVACAPIPKAQIVPRTI